MDNHFLYGICGGITGTIISHPFDTIKTRVQSNIALTISDAVKMKRLYAGITPPLIGIMLEKSIVFGFYNKAKQYHLNDFWSGIIGGFMCTLIVTPIDRLKINFQNKQPVTSSTVKTIYKGFIPTIFRETPGFGIYFTTYNYLSNTYNTDRQSTKTFLFGALSGLNAWIFIYPSDLIKTRIQSSNSNISIVDTIKNIYTSGLRPFDTNVSKQEVNTLPRNLEQSLEKTYTSGRNLEQSLEKTYSTKILGLRNFYTGFSLAIMRAMPLHGGVFLGYELSKKYI